MRSLRWSALAIPVAVALLGIASSAQAQVPTFTRIKDAVPSKFFDPATTTPDPVNKNRLRIGFNSGLDLSTFLFTDFRVSSLAFTNRTAHDTISFTVKAPAGYFIAKITYHQEGTGSTTRTAIAYGDATLLVDNLPIDLGSFTTTPTLSRTVDLAARHLRSVSVAVSDSLFATTGSLAITAADVVVELRPLT
jgi:hypothetical protein